MAYKKTFKVMYELYERVDMHTSWFDHFKQILQRVRFPKCVFSPLGVRSKLYPVMMNNLLPKIVFVFMLAMAANLCFSNPLSSKLDTNEIVSSSEENFTRMANISHLDLHASNLTVSANNTSLPNNGSEKNDDRNPVKKPNYAVYIDGIIRKTFFEHLFVFAILFFMLVLLMGRKRNKTWKTKIECGEKSQAKPSEPVTLLNAESRSNILSFHNNHFERDRTCSYHKQTALQC
ncbi:hypothetical protein Tsp_09403 [Trichinella spiralis]|uniref:hypothetical protein n=1 Tax=Trichinella spiralis TaxID=6334 RepID=UPI0001EFD162|nr:hypothetical protein Tsp_09403 [Trichinella spiralis]